LINDDSVVGSGFFFPLPCCWRFFEISYRLDPSDTRYLLVIDSVSRASLEGAGSRNELLQRLGSKNAEIVTLLRHQHVITPPPMAWAGGIYSSDHSG